MKGEFGRNTRLSASGRARGKVGGRNSWDRGNVLNQEHRDNISKGVKLAWDSKSEQAKQEHGDKIKETLNDRSEQAK